MKTFLQTGAGLLAATALALMPVQASAQIKDYDPAIYDLLLDCAALHVLLAQAADKDADKDKATKNAVGFITGAEAMSGAEIKDYAAVLNPRKDKLLDLMSKKDPALVRTMKSCAAIEKVGRVAATMTK